MNKELGDIAIDVLKKDNLEELNESFITALKAAINMFRTPMTGDATYMFTAIEQQLEAELRKVQSLKERFSLDPVKLLTGLLDNIDIIKRKIKSDQKFAAEDGAIKMEIPENVAAYIAGQFSLAVIAALEDTGPLDGGGR